jgi:hypothetical protein
VRILCECIPLRIDHATVKAEFSPGRHGIKAMPERITKQLLKVQSGTLYPLLHRLVADGWLIKTREEHRR